MTKDGPAPPALGVKVNVASTLTLPATRSEAATLNVTELTTCPLAEHRSTAKIKMIKQLPKFRVVLACILFVSFRMPEDRQHIMDSVLLIVMSSTQVHKFI